MSKAGKPVIFQGREFKTLTALAQELGKTVSQIKNHLDTGTPVIDYEPHCVDYKLSFSDIANHMKKYRKFNDGQINSVER